VKIFTYRAPSPNHLASKNILRQISHPVRLEQALDHCNDEVVSQ
jgi:hypothetical protein